MSDVMKECKYKKLQYVVHFPEDFKKEKEYPVILLLAGAGSRGDDISLVRSSLLFPAAENFHLNTVIFAPQCYADSWFDIFEQLIEFAEYVIGGEYADEDRIYLMGSSMGGYAVWQLAMSRPEWFAAIVPICGGGMYWNAARLKHMGVWAFHGSEDPIVLCEESRKMVNNINRNGGDARLTIWKDVGHDSWGKTYQYMQLYEWLFRQRRREYQPEKSAYDNPKEFG